MEPSERRQRAMEALNGCHIIRKKKDPKKKVRKVESLIQKKPEMNRSLYNQCAKKHRYRTQADATRHMHILQTIRPEKELRCYQCDACLGWHITSKPKRRPGTKRIKYRKPRQKGVNSGDGE